MNVIRLNRILFSAPMVGLLMLLSGCAEQPSATVSKQIDWSPGNKWMVADLHSHTKFSDGALPVDELAKNARLGGCDVLAITDHTDVIDAGSDAYFDAIEKTRAEIKSLLLIGGLEWNIPPYGGREHVSILSLPNSERRLKEFRSLFQGGEATAADGFDWLDRQLGGSEQTVAIYNHPSRKVEDVAESGADFLAWTARHDVMIGFEGAPGHMKDKELGSYRKLYKPIDHWDPLAAEVGGVWDSLLDQGHNPHAAIAFSDYHNDRLDHPPCTFSKTHLLVPERTIEGVFAALRAGSFWAGHGNVLQSLRLELMTEGLIIPAIGGEVIEMAADSPYRLTATLERQLEFANSTLIAELIGNGKNGTPELLERRIMQPSDSNAEWQFTEIVHPRQSAFFRLRVRLERNDGPDYVAYTNAIRVNIH